MPSKSQYGSQSNHKSFRNVSARAPVEERSMTSRDAELHDPEQSCDNLVKRTMQRTSSTNCYIDLDVSTDNFRSVMLPFCFSDIH